MVGNREPGSSSTTPEAEGRTSGCARRGKEETLQGAAASQHGFRESTRREGLSNRECCCVSPGRAPDHCSLSTPEDAPSPTRVLLAVPLLPAGAEDLTHVEGWHLVPTASQECLPCMRTGGRPLGTCRASGTWLQPNGSLLRSRANPAAAAGAGEGGTQRGARFGTQESSPVRTQAARAGQGS